MQHHHRSGGYGAAHNIGKHCQDMIAVGLFALNYNPAGRRCQVSSTFSTGPHTRHTGLTREEERAEGPRYDREAQQRVSQRHRVFEVRCRVVRQLGIALDPYATSTSCTGNLRHDKKVRSIAPLSVIAWLSLYGEHFCCSPGTQTPFRRVCQQAGRRARR